MVKLISITFQFPEAIVWGVNFIVPPKSNEECFKNNECIKCKTCLDQWWWSDVMMGVKVRMHRKVMVKMMNLFAMIFTTVM